MNLRAIIDVDTLPRRTFTVKDLERMSDIGLFGDERLELVCGELIKMSDKGVEHETLKMAICQEWLRSTLDDGAFIPATTLRLADDTCLEVDFLVFPRAVGVAGIHAASTLLIVELAASSLDYDLGPKSLVYAHFGVRELWVIDAHTLTIHVHLDPADGRYRSIASYHRNDRVVPRFASGKFALRLADFDLDV